jgi:uncharacterized protein with PQ loop repeat
MQSIGHITLNISLLIYLIYFIPQIIHNHRQNTTADISLATHSLMVASNMMDLIYGFGFSLEWQYRLVTTLTLSFLMIQQFQILKARYDLTLKVHTLIICIITAAIILLIYGNIIPRSLLITAGIISSIIYCGYWIPQIILNFKLKKADGFSIIYLRLVFIACMCDLTSALSLGWPYPSVVTPIIIMSMILIIFYQRRKYKKIQDHLVHTELVYS